MRLDSIAWNNIRRRKVRGFFIALGIALAVATVVAVYTSTMAMKLELADRFDEIGANILVVPDLNNYAMSYGGITVAGANMDTLGYLENDDVVRINGIHDRESIATVAPKTLAFMEVNGAELLVVGVDFPAELQLKKWWSFRGEEPRRVDHVLLGAGIADKLGLQSGSELSVAGESYQVTAVLEPQGTEEDGLIFMQLLTVQRLAGLEGKLSLIEVAAYCTTCPLPEIVDQIQHVLPQAKVTALREAVLAREMVIDRFYYFAVAVGAVLFAIGTLMVVVTVTGSVNQRTKEIGILRAIGYRKSHVIEIILTEAVLLGFVGGLAGYLLGMGAAKILAPTMAGMQVAISWNPLLGVATAIGAIGLSLISSSLPAIRAAALEPVDALRHI